MQSIQLVTSDRHNEAETVQPGALIIGASSGIGAALARELADRGYALALLARRAAALDTLCAEINRRANAEIARAYPHDVRDYAAAPDLYAHILRQFGEHGATLRALIYVAGVMPAPEGNGEWSFEDERAMLETNALGAIRWLDLGAATFGQRGRGALVGVSSVAGDRGRRGNGAYMASKAALSTYLESLRYRLHARYGAGIRVVTVKPGYVATDLLANAHPPRPMVVSAQAAARPIANACEHGPEVVYVPSWWRLVMAGIKALPGFAMSRLPL